MNGLASFGMAETDAHITEDTATFDVVELAADLRLVIARLHRQLRQQDQSGLSPSLATSLATISREGEITLGALAAQEQITPPTVTRIVERLVDLGLVSRRVDDDDRRVVKVRLTAAGRRRLDVSRTRRIAWLTARLNELEGDDLAHLRDGLEVLESLVLAPEIDADR